MSLGNDAPLGVIGEAQKTVGERMADAAFGVVSDKGAARVWPTLWHEQYAALRPFATEIESLKTANALMLESAERGQETVAGLRAELERLRMFEAMHIAKDKWLDAGPVSETEDALWRTYLRARGDYEARYGAVR